MTLLEINITRPISDIFFSFFLTVYQYVLAVLK